MRWLFCSLFGLAALFSRSQLVTAGEVTPYFSSQVSLSDRLVEEINREKETIYAAVYCFSHRAVADALIQAQQRGVHVEMLVDTFTVESASKALDKVVRAGIPVYVWHPPKGRSQGVMHDKFCILGTQRVWTGSFNWTYAATKYHCENALVILDPEVNRRYLAEFMEIRQNSDRLQPK